MNDDQRRTVDWIKLNASAAAAAVATRAYEVRMTLARQRDPALQHGKIREDSLMYRVRRLFTDEEWAEWLRIEESRKRRVEESVSRYARVTVASEQEQGLQSWRRRPGSSGSQDSKP